MENLRFIGITGGVGVGKSEILKYIQKHYRCRIYLADEVAGKVQQSGTEGFAQLVDLLGESVIGPDGELDRGRMAELIFADDALRRQVNDLIHPQVRIYLMERLEEAKKDDTVELFFVEAALLIETGYGTLVDEMWYIYADRDTRIKRLKENRGYSEERIAGIMDAQLSEDEFRKACDFVIDNSGRLEDSYRQIDEKLEAFTWQN